MNDSRKLLEDYTKGGSEAAFRQLVDRYVGLVHSTALRLVNGDSHQAEDVTQTVFRNLARNAGTLSDEVMVGGWLHRHTCFVASTMMRGERRRQNRERQAVAMNASEDHSAANLANVAPLLDDAIDELGPEDRAAILLRFFEQLEFRAVGDSMGINEDAARMRVNRALDKLHSRLTQRGLTLSAAALGAALAAGAVKAAPVGLASSVATASLAGAAKGGATLTIVKIMSFTKIKIALASALAVAALAAPLVIQHQSLNRLHEENQALQQQAAQLAPLQSENQRLSNLVVQANTASAASEKQVRDLARLRAEVSSLRQQTNDLVKAVASLRLANSGQSNFRTGKRVFHNMTMAQFAKFIGGVLEAPVADQTGLTGTYEIVMTPPRIGGEDGKLERVTGILLNDLGLQLAAFAGPFTAEEQQFGTGSGGRLVLPDGTVTNYGPVSSGNIGGFALRLDHADAPGLKPGTGEPVSDDQMPGLQAAVGQMVESLDLSGVPPKVANNLRLIDFSKQQWALEHRKQNIDTPTWQDIQPYLGPGANGGLSELTNSPDGVYVINSVGRAPQFHAYKSDATIIGGGFAEAADPATAKQNQCINHLRLFDSAKQQWAREFRKKATDTPTMEDLRPYLGRGQNGELPVCPDGGVYTIGIVGEKPTCSVPGHVLP
jgi:RNA polymerase sigma factor (sigma-70 family)